MEGNKQRNEPQQRLCLKPIGQLVQQLVENQSQTMQSAPNNKANICSVPQSSDKHSQKQIQIASERTLAVASHAYVKIIPQPRRQTYVPTSPKLGYVVRFVRRVEVNRQTEAEQKSNRNRNVGISRKITIDLQGIAIHRHEVFKRRIHQRHIKHPIDKVYAYIVRNDYLLNQAFENEKHAPRKFCFGQRIGLVQLRQKVFGSDNRTCDKLRKEAEIESKIDKRGLLCNLSAVYVGKIGDCLKGIERNSDRKNNLIDRKTCSESTIGKQSRHIDNLQRRSETAIYNINNEIRILEITKEEKIDHNTENKRGFSCFRAFQSEEQPAKTIRQNRSNKEQKHKKPARKIVKQETDHQKIEMPCTELVSERRIEHQNHSKEHPEQRLSKQQRIILRKSQ